MSTIDRQQVNFEGNERVDLPDFRAVPANVAGDFRRLIRAIIDDVGVARVFKPFLEGTHVGLTFKIRTDVQRAYLDPNGEWVYKAADVGGSTVNLALAANSVNYVEVAVSAFTDNAQTRAFWDRDLNPPDGGEFFDTINVRSRIDESFSSNTVGPTAGRVPLFIVTTNGVGIVSVVPVGDLFGRPRAFVLPAPNARTTAYGQISDLRRMWDFLAALVTEAKGTGQAFERAPYSSLKLLREGQVSALTSEIVVTFGRTFGANNVNFSANFNIDIAGRPSNPYVIAAGTYAIADGEVLYATIPETAPGGPIAPIAVAIAAAPIDPFAGGDPKHVVLYVRRGSTIYGLNGMPSVDFNASIATGAAALPQEATVPTVTAQVDYTFPFTFDPGNDILDVQLWVDTGYIKLDPAGVDGFMKIGPNSIRIPADIPTIDGKELTLRKISTNTGGGAIIGGTVQTKVATKTTAGAQVFTHGFGVEPHMLHAEYNDGVNPKIPVDPAAVVVAITATTITVDPGVLPIGGGETLKVYASYNQVTSAMT